MTGLGNLIRRNCKLFFKDKGLFFTAMITPLILLMLYATFLAKLYRDSFVSGFGDFPVPDTLIDAIVGGQLLSSLLAVCCVTVAFCSNMLMVQDKVNGSRKDLTMTPVKKSTMALGYYVSTAISTLIICYVATGAGLVYVASVGWYMSVKDILLILADVFLLVMFGTALSSIINLFLSTQGQISAVGSVVSSIYGFICGAYMPISQFGDGLQRAISFLPGTYGTALLRTHALRGVCAEMTSIGVPADAVEDLKNMIDCNVYFFGDKVAIPTMYLILGGAVLLLMGVYVVLHLIKKK